MLVGGWAAKMGAVTLYSGLATVYLKYFERPLGRSKSARIRDVFDTLTYRERYEDLLAAYWLRCADWRARSPFARILRPPRG